MQKWVLKAGLLAALIVSVEFAFGWAEGYAALRDFAQARSNPAAFVAAMGLGCAIGLPVSWCYFFSATAFGLWAGWGCCLAGLWTSSTIGFFASRLFLPRAALGPLLGRFNLKIGRFNLRMGEAEAECHLNFFVRAIPGVPYFMQNMLLAGIGTPYAMYSAMTMLVQGPIALAVCFFADAVRSSSYANAAAALLLVAALAAVHRITLRVWVRRPSQAREP